ncbi:hypothetical protein EV356DRAFT_163891 [Viridothelium virens]|uniref:Uncharacterized protein n=1 Tax=Viridothelium virens TaxID=1048519 RepID=A0A6A6HLT4_VIRVR|nr:hypothetical protein EV356DRAFT_163891 [Viridothelium virens]
MIHRASLLQPASIKWRLSFSEIEDLGCTHTGFVSLSLVAPQADDEARLRVVFNSQREYSAWEFVKVSLLGLSTSQSHRFGCFFFLYLLIALSFCRYCHSLMIASDIFTY